MKLKLKVKASAEAWGFYYNGKYLGHIWYDGKIGGICQETKILIKVGKLNHLRSLI